MRYLIHTNVRVDKFSHIFSQHLNWRENVQKFVLNIWIWNSQCSKLWMHKNFLIWRCTKINTRENVHAKISTNKVVVPLFYKDVCQSFIRSDSDGWIYTRKAVLADFYDLSIKMATFEKQDESVWKQWNLCYLTLYKQASCNNC